MQNKGLEETLILTWLDGFWDLGEGKLGNGCGCILWYCKSIKFTVTAPFPACIAAHWEGMHYIR